VSIITAGGRITACLKTREARNLPRSRRRPRPRKHGKIEDEDENDDEDDKPSPIFRHALNDGRFPVIQLGAGFADHAACRHLKTFTGKCRRLWNRRAWRTSPTNIPPSTRNG
jgi:hypothetical protein